MRKFAEAHGRDGHDIVQLLAQDDIGKARALVHKLKGTAGNLAMMAVWELAETIEQSLIAGDKPINRIQQLQSALDVVLSSIAHLSEKKQPPVLAITCVTDSNAPLPLLRELLQALDRDNPDEAEPSLSALENILPLRMVEPIRESLDNFDFRAAEEHTKKLIEQLNHQPESH